MSVKAFFGPFRRFASSLEKDVSEIRLAFDTTNNTDRYDSTMIANGIQALEESAEETAQISSTLNQLLSGPLMEIPSEDFLKECKQLFSNNMLRIQRIEDSLSQYGYDLPDHSRFYTSTHKVPQGLYVHFLLSSIVWQFL